jgi:hypothetical protein
MMLLPQYPGRRAAAAVLVAAVSAIAAAAPASADVTKQQAEEAASRAVAWFRTQQDAASGQIAGFGSDWAMIALASAGVNAADVRASLANPSLQDYFHGSWSGSGPGTAATDQERAILAGQAGGIQPSRLSASRNLVATLATFFDGSQLGSPALVTDDVFGLLALDRAGAAQAVAPALGAVVRSKQQAGSGGWNFGGSATTPDVDVTGAAIGALCSSGAGPDDPAVARALDYVASTQDAATGGFASSFFGANADSTGWVVNGLRRCGVDPQGPRWRTEQGKTPLDFLVSLQKPNGAFTWRPADTADNLYSTQNAVTALVGEGFAIDAPEREDPTQPRLRPAPEVAAGTPVPLTLVIDHGDARPGAERICSVTAPLGATAGQVLEAAAASTSPAYCVSGLRLEGDDDARHLEAVNGVTGRSGEHAWEVSVDGGEPRRSLTETVGLGDTIALRLATLAGTPSAPPPTAPLPPLEPVAHPGPGRTRARALLARGRILRLSRTGRIRVSVRCPRGVGAAGCQGVLRVRYRARSGRWVGAGSSSFTVRSGARRMVSVRLSRELRRLVARRPGGLRVRVEAAVRDRDTAALTVTRVRATVRR